MIGLPNDLPNVVSGVPDVVHDLPNVKIGFLGVVVDVPGLGTDFLNAVVGFLSVVIDLLDVVSGFPGVVEDFLRVGRNFPGFGNELAPSPPRPTKGFHGPNALPRNRSAGLRSGVKQLDQRAGSEIGAPIAAGGTNSTSPEP